MKGSTYMEEVLSLIQRAKNSIALGESHFREFKTAVEGKPGQKKPRRVAAICSEIGEALLHLLMQMAVSFLSALKMTEQLLGCIIVKPISKQC